MWEGKRDTPNAAPDMISPSDGEFGSMRPDGGTITLGLTTPPQLPKIPEDFLKLTLEDEAVLARVSGSELGVEPTELSESERTLVGTRDMAGVV